MNDYIPRGDANALGWMRGFFYVLNESPGVYGVLQTDLDTIEGAIGRYREAFGRSSTEKFRTKDSIVLKNETRAQAEDLCRRYAQQLRLNHGISNDSLIALGLNPRNSSRSRRSVTTTSPLLNIIAATPGAHTLRYSDSLSPDKRGKPRGAERLELVLGLAPAGVEILDPEECNYVGSFTKNPIGVAFDKGSNGLQATYYARWARGNSEHGPWSSRASMVVVGFSTSSARDEAA